MDRVGQIRTYTRWLQNRLGATIRGLWTAERVWEQSFARDLVDAGIEYTVLDDFHFKCAGLTDSQLTGHLLTEDEGRMFSVFPGSERLRYSIPFGDPSQTIEYLAKISEEHPNAVVVFGDDGEKFGTWPETRETRLRQRLVGAVFRRLGAESKLDSIDHAGRGVRQRAAGRHNLFARLQLPRDDRVGAAGRAAGGIRADRARDARRSALAGDAVVHARRFLRNFRVKYPEADEMYCRMMTVSRRLQDTLAANAAGDPVNVDLVEQARMELYRGQCNCGYWHGAFGGIYLPHLRNAVYQHLIAADNLLDRATGKPETWIEAAADDYNFDARQEVRLMNDKLMALVTPSRGGWMTELDVRRIPHNLLATLARRPEVYHRKVLAGDHQNGDQVASIHERVVFKQPGLEQRLQYDDHARKSLIDLFYDNDATLDAVALSTAMQRGDFVDGNYEARIRRNPDRIQVQLIREGSACGAPIRITKGLTLDAGSSILQVAYMLENVPQDRPIHFAVEFNFAGLPSNAYGRNFRDLDGRLLGQLGSKLDLSGVFGLGLTDEWLGIDVGLKMSRPTNFWTFPIETVSQSEGGFELVHQSVVVMPHWLVAADREGRWSVTMQMSLDTSLAESRAGNHEEAVAATT